mmetsp:Transcript_102023/g.304415  ORF Transcript_102023/g.304415 Transcript_102023/m.304415 type:complete len:251 (-) Transcript_102023:1044-1796(-)
MGHTLAPDVRPGERRRLHRVQALHRGRSGHHTGAPEAAHGIPGPWASGRGDPDGGDRALLQRRGHQHRGGPAAGLRAVQPGGPQPRPVLQHAALERAAEARDDGGRSGLQVLLHPAPRGRPHEPGHKRQGPGAGPHGPEAPLLPRVPAVAARAPQPAGGEPPHADAAGGRGRLRPHRGHHGPAQGPPHRVAAQRPGRDGRPVAQDSPRPQVPAARPRTGGKAEGLGDQACPARGRPGVPLPPADPRAAVS